MNKDNTITDCGICPTCNVPYDFCSCITRPAPGIFPEGIPVWWDPPPESSPTKIIIGIPPERVKELKQRLHKIQERFHELEVSLNMLVADFPPV